MSSSRTFEVPREKGGNEVKGILILIVCGLYAVLLFAMAALVTWAVAYLQGCVRSVAYKLCFREAKPAETKIDINHNVVRKAVREIRYG